MYEYPPEVAEYRNQVSYMTDMELRREVKRVRQMNKYELAAKWYIKTYLREELTKRKMADLIFW